MKLSTASTVPVYTISGASSARPLPEWLAQKRKRSLKNDPEYANRIELLQDFEFEEASQCIRISEDGQWVMSTGTYKPQIHTHYLPHLSLSFARHTVSLNTTFLLLSGDYSKSLHLQADRSIEFHTPQGCHYTLRLPRYGRDLKYDRWSAEALVPAVGVNENGNGEVFRLNLEVGRYMRSYEVDVGGDDLTSLGGGALQGGIHTGSVNVGAVAEDSHNLLAFGTSLGTVEFWDSRARARAGILHNPAPDDQIDAKTQITAVEFDRSGLRLATGSSSGLIHLYDLRSPTPLLKKDQGYGYPIQTLIFLTSSAAARLQHSDPKILSADRRIIKIWDAQTGTPWTSIEPAVDMNSVAWYKDTGMLLTANEGRQQHAFFIPQLGPAPKWCSFLDNLVEEMAEDPNNPNAFATQKVGSIYDNYKFLTIQQLQALNLSHLIGTTSLLRPYMHGYFVAQRLYEEAKVIANPFIWEEERNKRIREKITAERESRIRGKKKVTAKVNKRLAERLIDKAQKNRERQERRAKEKGVHDNRAGEAEKPDEEVNNNSDGLLTDPRFAKLFNDEDFAIDEGSQAFQSLNPNGTGKADSKARPRLTAAEEEALDDSRSLDEGDDNGGDSNDYDDHDESEKENSVRKQQSQRISSPSYKKTSKHQPRPPPPPELKISSSQNSRQQDSRSFGSRIKGQKSTSSSQVAVGGGREVTFAPKQNSKVQIAKDPEGINQRPEKSRRSASGNVFRRL